MLVKHVLKLISHCKIDNGPMGTINSCKFMQHVKIEVSLSKLSNY